MFGVPVKFNYGGKSQIKSIPGAMLSIILLLVIGAFAFQRFQELIYHSNPVISVARVVDAFDASHKVNMTENGFRMAFGVNNFKDNAPLDDPAYV